MEMVSTEYGGQKIRVFCVNLRLLGRGRLEPPVRPEPDLRRRVPRRPRLRRHPRRLAQGPPRREPGRPGHLALDGLGRVLRRRRRRTMGELCELNPTF